MPVRIEPLTDAAAGSALCAAIIAELPMWFGRPEANAAYIRGIAERDTYAAFVDDTPRGLMALEYHFAVTCNIWWIGISPTHHRSGLGRALIARAVEEAHGRGCRQLAVETMSPNAGSPEYDRTRAFYEAVGFVPFVEFEPEPGDRMMWMLRPL